MPVPGFVLDLKFGHEFGAVLRGGQRVIPRRALDLGYEFRFTDVDDGARRPALAGSFAGSSVRRGLRAGRSGGHSTRFHRAGASQEVASAVPELDQSNLGFIEDRADEAGWWTGRFDVAHRS